MIYIYISVVLECAHPQKKDTNFINYVMLLRAVYLYIFFSGVRERNVKARTEEKQGKKWGG